MWPSPTLASAILTLGLSIPRLIRIVRSPQAPAREPLDTEATAIRSRRIASLMIVLAAAAVIAAGCSTATQAQPGDALRVVATLPLLGQFASEIAGPDANVTTLIPLGVDEHAFQPSTTVARRVAEADLALVNGFRLEASLLSIVVENVRDGVPVVAAARGLNALVDGHDQAQPTATAGERASATVDAEVFAEGDPHLWLDARNAVRYAENIRDALIAVDPDHAEGYRTRAAALIGDLNALDAELRQTLAPVPPERRKIVVFHDAYEYFARAYGFEVIASVAPSNPNQAVSAAEIAEIVKIVEQSGVRTIYREPQYSGQTLDLIAHESGTVIAVLYSIPTDDVPTYAALMRANAQALVEGLAP